jgi:hypothetical protein
VHQRGITDEGVTDCTALPLVVPAMEKWFGLTKTVPVQTTRSVVRTLRRKIAGKWRAIKYRTLVPVTEMVPNPDYARAAGWALAWHRTKPPEYQGDC